MTKRISLLVVDDDNEIRNLLAQSLEMEGYEVDSAPDASVMMQKLSMRSFDLIIMDLMMPGEDGISATRRLRATSDTPIIMLTAKGEDIDRILGLEMGADDYVTKPFNTRELVARIRAVLRRGTMEETEKITSTEVLVFDRWYVNLVRRELCDVDGKVRELTSGEFDLLKIFVQAPGTVLSREALVRETKDRNLHAFDRSIDIQISRLRKKIEKDPRAPTLIKTIRSEGYMLTAQVRLETKPAVNEGSSESEQAHLANASGP